MAPRGRSRGWGFRRPSISHRHAASSSRWDAAARSTTPPAGTRPGVSLGQPRGPLAPGRARAPARRSRLVAVGAGRRRHPRGDDLRSNGARPLRDHEQGATLATSAERSVDRRRDCAERASAGRRDRLATARPRPPGRRRWCVEAAARAARRPLDVHARSCERGQDLWRGIHAERCDLERVRNALGIRERRCDLAVGWALTAAGAEELSLSAGLPVACLSAGSSIIGARLADRR